MSVSKTTSRSSRKIPSPLSNIELGPFDPYKHSDDPARNRYREGLKETIKLAELQYDYQIRSGLEKGIGYPQAAKNALSRYDNTIAEYKCRYF